MRLIYILGFLATVIISLQCSHRDEEIKASELINNPYTASEGKEVNKAQPVLHFENAEYNYGRVKAGTQVQHEFKFINKGNAPLIITNAYGSCGCTVAGFPKQPIAPGKSSSISVVFDTKGKNGKEIKYVSVVSNANPAVTELTLKGEVIE